MTKNSSQNVVEIQKIVNNIIPKTKITINRDKHFIIQLQTY